MPQPVIAYHLILTAYGFWLPNDPRGSGSKTVRAGQLTPFGPATKTDSRRSVAAKPHDLTLRREAKASLTHPPVRFSGEQARAVGQGFADYVARSRCVIHACAIMPDHVHFVIARHRYEIERVANLLKGAAATRLIREGLHPFAGDMYRNGRLPSPWARGHWAVFLFNEAEVRRAVDYVEANPMKQGLPHQRWRFVTPYIGR